ncbi:spore germination protein GerPC [Bacillus solitudinis]|uniref:spore germination protein GerPC n=1 Tax=Bacillus solitudinis TaxID=2014074 RepID=UPI000C248CBA|nr:spore germination protein GerPC [Bacillus solitudinis]
MYYNTPDTIQNLQQIYNYLNFQQQKIDQLEKSIQHLQTELNSLKQNKSPSIEKIEYKFDQLKVERLEGTLNIGITPNNGDNSIEDFAVNQHELNTPQVNDQQPIIFEAVQQRINDYLNEPYNENIHSIEKQMNYQLDDHYRLYIIEDIRKQVDHRIQHYLNKMKLHNLTPQQLAEIEEMTTNKVKEDIHKTYKNFIGNLPQKESDF